MLNQSERDPTAERVARNDAAFRDANERIRGVAAELELDDEGLLPFLCECADLGCTTVVQLSAAEYEEIRANPAWFLNALGHEVSAQGWAKVVRELDRFAIVEKIGDAGALAVELDPRAVATRGNLSG
jgi:hypothetical protein